MYSVFWSKFGLTFSFYLFQAYTMELEAEVAKLKEENQELLKKQVIMVIVSCIRIYVAIKFGLIDVYLGFAG